MNSVVAIFMTTLMKSLFEFGFQELPLQVPAGCYQWLEDSSA